MTAPRPPKRQAQRLLAEFNKPDSVVSKYVPPVPSGLEELLKGASAAGVNMASALPAAAAAAAASSSGAAAPSAKTTRAIAEWIAKGTADPASRPGSASGAASARLSRPQSGHRGALVPAPPPGSQSARSKSSAASTALVPHAGRNNNIPYHSPLQRQLLQLFPGYTEAQLTMHSKFTASFYLGPPCRSLEEPDATLPTVLQLDKPAPSAVQQRFAAAAAEKADAERRAAVLSGAVPHTPNALLPLAPTAAGGSALTPMFSTAPPLDKDQSALLASAFDRIDDTYPLPGAAPRPHQKTVHDTIAAINRDQRKNAEPPSRLEAELAAQKLAATAPPAGGKRQLVPKPEAGAGVYDVFNLPYGFKVVRDDSVDPRLYGSDPATNSGAPSSPSDPASILSADPSVKDRIRGVLEGIAAKYDVPSSTSHAQQAVVEAKEQSTSVRPASSASTRPSASSRAASASQQHHRVPSLINQSADRSSPTPPPLPAAPSAKHARSGTHAGPHMTPGPAIEYADLPAPHAHGRGASSATTGGIVSAAGGLIGNSLPDLGEVIKVDYAALAEKARRKRKTRAGRDSTVVGKPVSGAGSKKEARIRPSRGTQLLTRIGATVRVCCLVPSTGTVWSAQRDQVLVIRDRLTGKVVNRLDTPALILCMLLVDAHTMWLGMETGQILCLNVHTYKKLRQAQDHAGAIHALARGPEGVFSASNDFTMVHWSPAMEVKQHYMGHKGGVRCILVLSSGRVWSGSDDGSIRVWDVESGLCVEELVRHTGSVLSLITTGETIWSASEDGTLAMWSLYPSITCLKQLSTGSERINFLLLVGHQVWSCGQDPRIHIWRADNMEWLGSLAGHLRYVSNFLKVRVLEQRIIWSYGLGEEHVLVWRAEQVAEQDATDRLVALQAQLTTQADEIAHLRLRAETAEAARAESERLREEELASFQRQLEQLVLQLAQSASGKDGLIKDLADAKEALASLAAQNAQLRNELRLHLEKLTVSENLLKDQLDRLDAAKEHAERLQADHLLQASRARQRTQQMEEDYARLAEQVAGGAGAMAALTEALAAARARTAELERKVGEGSEGAAFYASEAARLGQELQTLKQQSRAAESSAKTKEGALQEQVRSLEAAILDSSLQRQLQRAETDALRSELATLRSAHEKLLAEKAAAAAQVVKADTTIKEQAAKAEDSEARAAQAAQAQARRIRQLEQVRHDLQAQLTSLHVVFDSLARDMRGVEKKVRDLARPQNELYDPPSPRLHTFQAMAAARAAGPYLDPMPPAAYFEELAWAHQQLSGIMHRCLSESQKLHVGFAPSGAIQAEARRAAKQAQKEKEARNAAAIQAAIQAASQTTPSRTTPAAPQRPSTSPAVNSSSRNNNPLQPSPPQTARIIHFAAASPLPAARDRMEAPVAEELLSSEDEGAETIRLVSDPAQSPVTAVWTADSAASSTLEGAGSQHSLQLTQYERVEAEEAAEAARKAKADAVLKEYEHQQTSELLQRAFEQWSPATTSAPQPDPAVATILVTPAEEPISGVAAFASSAPVHAIPASVSRPVSAPQPPLTLAEVDASSSQRSLALESDSSGPSGWSNGAGAAASTIPPLLSYPLDTIVPHAPPPFNQSAVETKRLADRARERNLMQLDKKRHQRKTLMQREKEAQVRA